MTILATETIHIELDGTHRPLERGLERVRRLAFIRFGIDEDGYSEKIPKWCRSSCHLDIQFVSISIIAAYLGGSTLVTFKADCILHDDEEEDDV